MTAPTIAERLAALTEAIRKFDELVCPLTDGPCNGWGNSSSQRLANVPL